MSTQIHFFCDMLACKFWHLKCRNRYKDVAEINVRIYRLVECIVLFFSHGYAYKMTNCYIINIFQFILYLLQNNFSSIFLKNKNIVSEKKERFDKFNTVLSKLTISKYIEID